MSIKKIIFCNSLLLMLVLFSSFNVDPVFENKVYCYIKSIGIKHPDIVLKQAIYESGHFNSNIYKTKNTFNGKGKSTTILGM